jgi:CHASE3 domain sensor protein
MVSPAASRSLNAGRTLAIAGLAGVLAFFLVSGGVAYFNIRTLRDDSQNIIHSHQVMMALDNVLSTAQDAETGQRGFLLTDAERYLAPYYAAKSSIAAKLDEVAGLIRDNPTQVTTLGRLRSHVDAKMAELQETIDLRRNRNSDAALSVVASDRGKAEMDAIRSELAAMTREEAGLREQRIAEMAASYQSAVLSSVLSALLGIVLAGVIGFLIRRAALARQRQQWLQEGQVGLSGKMLGDQNAAQLGDAVLGFLARYLGAQAGAIYVAEGDHFRRVSTYGRPTPRFPSASRAATGCSDRRRANRARC